MKKSVMMRAILLFVTATTLSGCIIWPWWDEDGRRHHGEREREYHHGEYEEHERR